MSGRLGFRLLAAALVIAALAAAFLLVDFRVSRGNLEAQTSTGSSRGAESAVPAGGVRVYVWVEEKDQLSTAMRDALAARLRAAGFDAQLVPAARPAADEFPLLRAWIARPTLSWTPVYASADLRVRFGFSSVGTEISQVESTVIPAPAAAPGELALNFQGSMELKDSSYGLISLRGYWRYLGDAAARYLTAELAREVK